MSADTTEVQASFPHSADDVAGVASDVQFGVRRQTWAEVAPGLPADVAQFVAPPVTVSASLLPGTDV
jgi:hypothetical protein